MRFFIAGNGDDAYLKGLIRNGNGERRDCVLHGVDGDGEVHEMQLPITPSAARFSHVLRGSNKGICFDLFGTTARIRAKQDADGRYELIFDGGAPPARLIRRLRTKALQPS